MYSRCPIIQSLASSCPVLGLFSPSVFLYTLHSFHNNYLNLALCLHLVLLAPVNSCELHNYYLVLSFLFMYSVCLPMFFPNKTNINTVSYYSCNFHRK